jgi:hypothetical protein
LRLRRFVHFPVIGHEICHPPTYRLQSITTGHNTTPSLLPPCPHRHSQRFLCLRRRQSGQFRTPQHDSHSSQVPLTMPVTPTRSLTRSMRCQHPVAFLHRLLSPSTPLPLPLPHCRCQQRGSVMPSPPLATNARRGSSALNFSQPRSCVQSHQTRIR